MTVNLAELPSVPFDERNTLPDEAAVYFVLDGDGTVLYVGQSLSVAQRWRNHHRLKQFWTIGARRIAWASVSDPALLLEVERACIEHFHPTLNGTETVGFSRADDRITVSFPATIGRDLRAMAGDLAIPVSILIKQWTVERLRRERRQPRARREEDA